MRIIIASFDDSYLDGAGGVLAARHRANLLVEGALPVHFTEREVARLAVETVWRKQGARGVVAVNEETNALLGYLIGSPQIDPIWGRSAWISSAGHALERSQGVELYQDLYAALSASWVAAGMFNHYIVVSAFDWPSLDAWFALSFGQQQAYALRDLSSVPELHFDPSLEIRSATLDDLEALLELITIVGKHQARSPVYAAFLPEEGDPQRRRADLAELLANEQICVWLAWRKGRVLGFQIYEPMVSGPDALFVPNHCIELSLAATREDERGSGVGLALTHYGLFWAQQAGYMHCLLDWRTTNLLAARYWPRRGFRPVAYRLTRTVDERVTWAHG